MGKSEVVYGLQGHRVTRLSFSPKRMENKSTPDRYNKNNFHAGSAACFLSKEVTAEEESWGDTSVFSTVAAVCKVARWAFNTAGAAVVEVVGALYRG